MTNTHPDTIDEARLHQLVVSVNRRAPMDAAVLLTRESDEVISAVLNRLDPSVSVRLLASLPEKLKEELAQIGSTNEAWQQNLNYPAGSVGRLMEPATVFLSPQMTVQEAVEAVRPFATMAQLVYAYVVDGEDRLEGVVAMRDLLFAADGAKVSEVMVTEPFTFKATSTEEEAAKAAIQRHYPVYPVCDDDGKLLGLIRGYALFEQQTVTLASQAGQMVGIEKEEHLSTPLTKSLLMRHPWLQLNLLTAFVAGGVVGLFEDTITQVVTLAAFLPVLAGQAGNTGCQALAVTLRAMTLNELKPGMEKVILRKEFFLGISNGLLVGCTAGLAMFAYALVSGTASPVILAMIVVIAMLGSCMAAGVSGVMIPLALRRFGADPATASTIFLTTATDVVSMGALLGFASLII